MPLINTDYYLQLKKSQLNFDVLIPFREFKTELIRELDHYKINYFYIDDKIALIEPTDRNIIWAQDHWNNVKSIDTTVDFKSALLTLKSLKNLGYHWKTTRSKHIENKLETLKLIPEKRITFNPSKKFNFKFYIFTIFKDVILYSESPKAQYPGGWNEFVEDKENPPNRAYLKLWEVITTENLKFSQVTEALEIGASPGGWSWVLSSYFSRVHTFDRAPLDPKISKIKNIEHNIGDAFKVLPADYPNVTWFFSDLICTPEKIYETIQYWLQNSRVQNYICTIKFKGECNFEIIDKLLEIPHSKIRKLYHNKHEVTWIRQVKNE